MQHPETISQQYRAVMASTPKFPYTYRHMATLLRSLLMTVGLAMLLTLPLRAQNPTPSAAISAVVGTVTDANGNAVEGATVVLQAGVSSEPDTLVTTDNGFFDFESLKPGTYQITVHAQGFADWSSPPFSLQRGEYRILSKCKLRSDQGRTTVRGNHSPRLAIHQVRISRLDLSGG